MYAQLLGIVKKMSNLNLCKLLLITSLFEFIFQMKYFFCLDLDM